MFEVLSCEWTGLKGYEQNENAVIACVAGAHAANFVNKWTHFWQFGRCFFFIPKARERETKREIEKTSTEITNVLFHSFRLAFCKYSTVNVFEALFVCLFLYLDCCWSLHGSSYQSSLHFIVRARCRCIHINFKFTLHFFVAVVNVS